MNPTIIEDGVVTNGKATQKIISFFAQDEYRPIDKLILTAGVRENSNSMVVNEDPLYSPKVSALYHLNDDQSIWASSSKDYRTPDFLDHDLSLLSVAPIPGIYPGYVIRGSTDLKPEESFTQEAGYRGLFLDQKLKADATLFLTDVKDVIVINEYASGGTTSNDGSVVDKGAELALDYQLTNNLSFSTDYSYIYPHSKPETLNTPATVTYDTTASNNIVGIGTRYTLNKFKFDLYAKYFEGYENQNVAPTLDVKVRGYYESSLRVSYDFKTPGFTGKHDATVYLDVNDFLGAHQTESAIAEGVTNKILIKPEFTAGVKVTF